jgi:hypothetical protein
MYELRGCPQLLSITPGTGQMTAPGTLWVAGRTLGARKVYRSTQLSDPLLCEFAAPKEWLSDLSDLAQADR